ncbi:hypothetical protein PR048_014770 [Dryococelus australis]|uniref:Uncharacterized protein n=1 Tax=Dryococelus australis TaxID=614101 RepID=A0ABQ9HF29_9NEOP|nr:hypothetical protein PR048_014770 [Dryococelus australis]
MAVWDSLLVSLQICYWVRVVQDRTRVWRLSCTEINLPTFSVSTAEPPMRDLSNFRPRGKRFTGNGCGLSEMPMHADHVNTAASADLPWHSRLERHRSGVREALGSNPGILCGHIYKGSIRIRAADRLRFSRSCWRGDFVHANVTTSLPLPATLRQMSYYICGRSWIFICGNPAGRCRWSVGFLGDLPFPQPFHSGAAPYSPRFTPIGSQDLNVKSRPKLFTRSLISASRVWDNVAMLDSTVMCILQPQMYAHWLLPQRVASVTSHLAVWQSLLVSLQVCYWLRVVQGVSNKLRSNCKVNFTVHGLDVYLPMTAVEVNMARRRNEGAGETGDPRENPPTNAIVRHDSHMRKSGDPGRELNPVLLGECAVHWDSHGPSCGECTGEFMDSGETAAARDNNCDVQRIDDRYRRLAHALPQRRVSSDAIQNRLLSMGYRSHHITRHKAQRSTWTRKHGNSTLKHTEEGRLDTCVEMGPLVHVSSSLTGDRIHGPADRPYVSITAPAAHCKRTVATVRRCIGSTPLPPNSLEPGEVMDHYSSRPLPVSVESMQRRITVINRLLGRSLSFNCSSSVKFMFCTVHPIRGKHEISGKTRRPTASSGTIPTCENPVTRPVIEPGSPWWLIAQPPRPSLKESRVPIGTWVLSHLSADNASCKSYVAMGVDLEMIAETRTEYRLAIFPLQCSTGWIRTHGPRNDTQARYRTGAVFRKLLLLFRT